MDQGIECKDDEEYLSAVVQLGRGLEWALQKVQSVEAWANECATSRTEPTAYMSADHLRYIAAVRDGQSWRGGYVGSPSTRVADAAGDKRMSTTLVLTNPSCHHLSPLQHAVLPVMMCAVELEAELGLVDLPGRSSYLQSSTIPRLGRTAVGTTTVEDAEVLECTCVEAACQAFVAVAGSRVEWAHQS